MKGERRTQRSNRIELFRKLWKKNLILGSKWIIIMGRNENSWFKLETKKSKFEWEYQMKKILFKILREIKFKSYRMSRSQFSQFFRLHLLLEQSSKRTTNFIHFLPFHRNTRRNFSLYALKNLWRFAKMWMDGVIFNWSVTKFKNDWCMSGKVSQNIPRKYSMVRKGYF